MLCPFCKNELYFRQAYELSCGAKVCIYQYLYFSYIDLHCFRIFNLKIHYNINHYPYNLVILKEREVVFQTNYDIGFDPLDCLTYENEEVLLAKMNERLIFS
jgi:hypothetical protein